MSEDGLENLFGTKDLLAVLALTDPAHLTDQAELRLGYLKQLVRNHPSTCSADDKTEYGLRLRRVKSLKEIYDLMNSSRPEDIRKYLEDRQLLLNKLVTLSRPAERGKPDVPIFEQVAAELTQLIKTKLKKLEELNKQQ